MVITITCRERVDVPLSDLFTSLQRERVDLPLCSSCKSTVLLSTLEHDECNLTALITLSWPGDQNLLQ